MCIDNVCCCKIEVTIICTYWTRGTALARRGRYGIVTVWFGAKHSTAIWIKTNNREGGGGERERERVREKEREEEKERERERE